MPRHKRDKRLNASTLPELLVMMIVAGVVFLGVMDGLPLFVRYSADLSVRITVNSDFYDSYYRFGEIVTNADSICGGEDILPVFCTGKLQTVLEKRDSLLLSIAGDFTDTLFRNTISMTAVTSGKHEDIADSVCVSLAIQNGDALNISFPVKTPVHIAIRENIEETEKEYAYE